MYRYVHRDAHWHVHYPFITHTKFINTATLNAQPCIYTHAFPNMHSHFQNCTLQITHSHSFLWTHNNSPVHSYINTLLYNNPDTYHHTFSHKHCYTYNILVLEHIFTLLVSYGNTFTLLHISYKGTYNDMCSVHCH